MKLAKPVLFAVILSSLSLAIAQSGGATRRGFTGPSEPTGPVSALATLVTVQDSAQGRFAVIKFNLVAHTADITATVHEFDQTRKTSREIPLASLDLKRGEARSVVVRVPVQIDRESLLAYKVKARGSDGVFTELTLYNRVPPAGDEPCSAVDEYVQCQGVTVPEVQP